jgi:hypothetical protein
MVDQKMTAISQTAHISVMAARWAIAAAVTALLLLASLHLLSPEFNPSWRMISEYANGQYGWVLSFMFAAWAVSSWVLAVTIWSQIATATGKTGLYLLVASGLGEAMACVFDINHPLHDVAGALGILGLPIAAVLISLSLSRNQAWSDAKKVLVWTAHFTWISLVLLAASLALMTITYLQAGGKLVANVITLPPGTIALVGWTNRLLVVAYCLWLITVAWQALKLRGQ